MHAQHARGRVGPQQRGDGLHGDGDDDEQDRLWIVRRGVEDGDADAACAGAAEGDCDGRRGLEGDDPAV